MSYQGIISSVADMAALIITACERRGFFELLDTREFRTRRWLVEKLKANEGYFTVALGIVESTGWLEKDSKDAYRLKEKTKDDLARFNRMWLDSAGARQRQDGVVDIAASYRCLLDGMDDLLFGNHSHIFSRFEQARSRDANTWLNVIVGRQRHETYGKYLQEEITNLFDQRTVEEQPQVVIDVNCGDGALLKEVFQTIRDQTTRGRHLEEFPIFLVAVGRDSQVLREKLTAMGFSLRELACRSEHGPGIGPEPRHRRGVRGSGRCDVSAASGRGGDEARQLVHSGPGPVESCHHRRQSLALRGRARRLCRL